MQVVIVPFQQVPGLRVLGVADRISFFEWPCNLFKLTSVMNRVHGVNCSTVQTDRQHWQLYFLFFAGLH